MNSAKELLQFNFDADVFTRSVRPPNPMPREKIANLERISKKHDAMGGPSDLEDLRQIYHIFLNAIRTGQLRIEFNSLRRIRQLARALTYSEDDLPRIVDTPELRDALQLIKDRFSRDRVPVSMTLGVFDALLNAWDVWGAGLLRAFVRRHLADYDGRRRFVQNLKTNLAWYCDENGATQLAINLLRRKMRLSEVWSYLNLPDYMHGYHYFSIVGREYVKNHFKDNHRLERETVEDIIEFVEMHRNDKASRGIVSRIIEKLGIDASKNLRQPVQSYVFREWQDPRLAGGDERWLDVSDEARQIFTRWITKEDLRFFFDEVAQECNDPKFAYRKAFWLAYLEHISFCRPVLSKNVHRLLRNNPQALEYYRERQPATLAGGTYDQHAFIIQMGTHTFVEFSTAGACYVYDNASCPFGLGDSVYHMSELRNQLAAEHRVIHSNSDTYHWQRNFSWWIRRELGIEPLRSYR